MFIFTEHNARAAFLTLAKVDPSRQQQSTIVSIYFRRVQASLNFLDQS